MNLTIAKRTEPCVDRTSILAGFEFALPRTIRTFASTLPCVDFNLRFGLGPTYRSGVSGKKAAIFWKKLLAGFDRTGEAGRTNDGGGESVVSTVQLPFTALWISARDTKFAGGVRNGGDGKTGSGTAAGGGVDAGGVLANALPPGVSNVAR